MKKKESHELLRDSQEDHNLPYEVCSDYLLSIDASDYSDNTYLENFTLHDVNDVIYDIQKLTPQNNKKLGRYLQYLKRVEEYEISCKRSKE